MNLCIYLDARRQSSQVWLADCSRRAARSGKMPDTGSVGDKIYVRAYVCGMESVGNGSERMAKSCNIFCDIYISPARTRWHLKIYAIKFVRHVCVCVWMYANTF